MIPFVCGLVFFCRSGSSALRFQRRGFRIRVSRLRSWMLPYLRHLRLKNMSIERRNLENNLGLSVDYVHGRHLHTLDDQQ